MGNNSSLPEKVYATVQRNDVCAFQTLVATLNTAGVQPAARASVLEYKDKSGRTPLLVAASKNHYQILQQLIQLGANVHYINPSRDCAGGALHEAASRRHEAAVEALLAAGACPFAANAAGRTALDEAVLSGHTGVVRAIEKYAECAGLVAFKTRKMGGLTSKYKARWVVLMPYIPFVMATPSGPTPADPQRPRRLLWLYKDKASVSPRCRLWVDGATVTTHGPAGTEGTLRLHTSHGEPVGDLSTTYSHGYCASMRPADLTPAAVAVYHRLVALLNAGSPAAQQLLQQQQQQRPPAAVAPLLPVTPPRPAVTPPPPPAQPGAAAPPAAAPFYPAVQPVVGYGGSAGTLVLMPPPPPPPGTQGPTALAAAPAPQSGPLSAAYPGASGPILMASPLSLHQQRQRQQTGATAAAGGGGVGPRPDGCEPAMGSGGGVIGATFIEHMAAIPGESDEEFAARLASAISVTSGQSQQTLFPHQHQQQQQQQQVARPKPPAAAPSSPGPTSAPAPQPQRQSGTAVGQASTGGRLTSGGGGGHINFHSDPGNGPGPGPGGVAAAASAASASGSSAPLQQRPGRPAAAGAAGGGSGLALDDDDLDMDAVNEVIAAAGGGGAVAEPPRPPEDAAPSAPPAAAVDPVPASPARLAPHRPPPVGASSASPAADPEAELCIICLCAPKEVGFLHGDSVHRCVCRACSSHIAVGASCPLCRQRVERVLGVY